MSSSWLGLKIGCLEVGMGRRLDRGLPAELGTGREIVFLSGESVRSIGLIGDEVRDCGPFAIASKLCNFSSSCLISLSRSPTARCRSSIVPAVS